MSETGKNLRNARRRNRRMTDKKGDYSKQQHAPSSLPVMREEAAEVFPPIGVKATDTVVMRSD